MADDTVTWVAFNRVFNECGIKPLNYEAFKQNFCLPCSDFLIKMNVPEDAIRNFASIFNPLYLELLDRLKLFPDVNDCLDTLKERGIKMGVVSATPKELLWPALEKLGLTDYFKTIIGDAEKPSPSPIYRVCEAIGTYPAKHVAFVGDMQEDIICARRAGVTPIGIWRADGGYHDKGKLKAQNPRYIVSDLRELVEILVEK